MKRIIVTDEMRQAFRQYLREMWNDNEADVREVFESVEDVYGYSEIDDVALIEVREKEFAIVYGSRELVLDESDDPFIRSVPDGFTWVGDDCDYYGEILHYFHNLHKEGKL